MKAFAAVLTLMAPIFLLLLVAGVWEGAIRVRAWHRRRVAVLVAQWVRRG